MNDESEEERMRSSRRSFMQYLAAVPMAASAASLGAMVESSTSSATKHGPILPDRTGRVDLAVTFSGPSVSIVEGNDVIVFFPKLEDHDGGVGTSANEAPLAGNADYEVFGLPSPTSATQVLFPPLRCHAEEPYAQAQRLRNFTIRLRRPDLLQGMDPVDVFLSDQATIPADTSMQTLPTALRFIYRNVPPDFSLQISGPSSFMFEPSFDLDRGAGIPMLGLTFQYSPGSRRDPCHRDATASFKKLLDFFPAAGNVQSIKFAHDDPTCSLQPPSAGFTHVGYSLREKPESIYDRPRLVPVNGPGHLCESPVMGHW